MVDLKMTISVVSVHSEPFLVHNISSHDALNMYIGDYTYLISEASRTSIQDTVALLKSSSYYSKISYNTYYVAVLAYLCLSWSPL